jgi:hypothetical protein
MTVTMRDLELPHLGDLSVQPVTITPPPAMVTPSLSSTAPAPAIASGHPAEGDHSASYWVRRRREQARLAAEAAALAEAVALEDLGRSVSPTSG